MENFLIKALKYVPRRIKNKIIADIKSDILALNNEIPNLKAITKLGEEPVFEIAGIMSKLNKTILVNKFFLKQCAEIFAGVDFVGQELQDMYAFLYFKGKRDGFFIDIGAYDGVTISNTFALENIGWKGVCVEPIQEIFQRLVKNRKCDCVNAAIYNEETEIEVLQTKGGRSGIIKNMSEGMVKAAEREGIIDKYSITTINFTSLMKKYDIEYIDFLSIDVEGAELSVLSSIDFNKYKFGLITIENNHGVEQLKNFMSIRDYKLFLDLGVDLLFIPKKIEIGKYWWIDP